MSITNNDCFEKLKKLVATMPKCRVIPLVSDKVCNNSVFYNAEYSTCKFGEPYVMKYCYYAMGGAKEKSLYTEHDMARVNCDMEQNGIEKVEWLDGIFVPINVAKDWKLRKNEAKEYWDNYYSQ